MISFLIVFFFLGILVYIDSEKKLFLSFIGGKIVMAFVFLYVYDTFYDGVGDVYQYEKLLDALSNYKVEDNGGYYDWLIGISQFEMIWNNRLNLYLRFLHPLYGFCSDNLMALTVLWNLLVFIPLWYCRKLLKLSRGFNDYVFLGVLLIPSIFFWSSTLLKEGFCLSLMLVLVVVQTLVSDKILAKKWLLLVLLLIVFMWFFRYFLGVVLLVEFGLYLIFKIYKPTLRTWSAFAGFIVLASFLHPNTAIHHVFFVIQQQYNVYLSKSDGDLFLFLFDMKSPFFFSVLNAPLAFVQGLFRPVIGESFKWTVLLSGVENVIFFIGVIYALIVAVKKGDLLKTTTNPWLYFVLLLAVILPLSNPDLGTLSRYRVLYLPFVWYWIGNVLLPIKSEIKDVSEQPLD